MATPGAVAGLDGLWRAIGVPDLELDLGPLAPEDALSLARHVVKDGESQLALRVAEEAAGSPFFIAELGMYLHSFGAKQVGSINLDDVLRERVARLPAHERELLEVVAVAGEPISQRVAASALERSSAELARVIRHMRTEHLLRVPSGGATDQIECYHDRIREGVRRGLEIPRRRELCRGLAIALEQWSEGPAERRARYWRGAGDMQRAADYARAAGKDATRVLEFDRAARLHQLALELGDYGEEQARAIWRELGEAFDNAGRPAQAADAFLSASEGAKPGEGLELRHRSASVLLRGGYIEQGMAAYEEVLAEIGLKLSASPRRAISSVLWRRAFLRLRGLGFRQRSEGEIPRQVLVVADVCSSVAQGLGLVDNIRGAEFQARSLMLALRCGEPARVARSLGLEAGYFAGYGNEKRALEVVTECERISAEIGDDSVLPHALWARGAIALFCRSAWREGLARFDDGIAALRRNRHTGGWEMVTAQIYRAVALLRLGELTSLTRQIHRQLGEADRRGDLYASVTMRIRSNIVWLLRDQADEAEYELDDAMSSWLSPTMAFQLQHAWGMNAGCEIALYRGDARRAWEIVEETWPPLSNALLFRIPSIKIDCLHARARAALAQAARQSALEGMRVEMMDAAAYLRDAVNCARRLERERPPLGKVLAALVRASVADIRGQRANAIELMAAALAACEGMDLLLYANCARYRLGQLSGGMAGDAIVAEAELWLREQEVVDPEALVRMHVPGIAASNANASWAS